MAKVADTLITHYQVIVELPHDAGFLLLHLGYAQIDQEQPKLTDIVVDSLLVEDIDINV